MLYAKDPKPVTCHSREFEFDDLGTLHLKYYSNKHKVIRDYIFTSDSTPQETFYDVRDKLEERIARRKKKQLVSFIAIGVVMVLMLNITFALLYLMTH